MNWANRFLYRILRVLIRGLLWLFYPNAAVLNKERLKSTKPMIIACSHPNTMMDPLHAASRTKHYVHFLANADLFASRFGNWFYSNFFCIPILRTIDSKNKVVDNKASFERVIEFLGGGGCLWIAPEGGSYWGRHWLGLKTGTARIALLSEAAKEFELGLQILPVGLTYEAPSLFRTKLVINVGKPIEIQDYADDYTNDYEATVRTITSDLETALQRLELATSDEEEDNLLRKLEIILQNELPASNKASFFRSRQLLRQIQEQDSMNFRKRVDTYFELLRTHKLRDRSVLKYYSLSRFLRFLDYAWIVLGFPLFAYGFLNNALPAAVPEFIVRRHTSYIGYRDTVRMLIGLFVFPLFYVSQTWVVHSLLGMDWLTIVYAVSLLPAGLFSWHYGKWMTVILKRWKFSAKPVAIREEIVAARKVIVQELLT